MHRSPHSPSITPLTAAPWATHLTATLQTNTVELLSTPPAGLILLAMSTQPTRMVMAVLSATQPPALISLETSTHLIPMPMAEVLARQAVITIFQAISTLTIRTNTEEALARRQPHPILGATPPRPRQEMPTAEPSAPALLPIGDGKRRKGKANKI